jgi:hypothetical protein
VDYDLDKKMGEIIKEKFSKDEIVEINEKPSPQMVFYAGRNIFYTDKPGASGDFHEKRWKETNGALDGITRLNFEHGAKSAGIKAELSIVNIEFGVKKQDEPVDSTKKRNYPPN